ncbi:MAG: hypothetical protein J7K85_02540 [Anaerolineaceae bacterium]|nr:hypothetical protein [Anaerolineaceae bacterium]
MGLNFSVLPAFGDPLEPITDDVHAVNAITVDTQKMCTLEKPLTNPCKLLFDVIVLDCKGDAYLCCAYGNDAKYRIGNFLEMNYEKMMLSRLFNPQCRTCMMSRRSPSNEDLTDINKWFSRSFVVGDTEQVMGSVQESVFESEQLAAKLGESVAMRNARILELEKLLIDRDNQIGEFLLSTSWRISYPLRLVKEKFQKIF